MRLVTVPVLVALVGLAGCPGPSDPLPDGCITVDGEDGFASLGEAVAAATAGATIGLCEARFEASVVVDKDLTFAGVGDDDSYWAATGDAPAITVQGAQVTVSRIGFEGAGSPLRVEAGVLVVDRSAVYSPGEYGIHAIDSEVVAQEVRISRPELGGVLIEGGTLDLQDSEINDPVGFGVKAVGGQIHLARNGFSGTFPPDGASNVDDGGWAVWLDGAVGALEGNTFVQNAYGDVYVAGAGADLSMNGDTSTGAYIGVWFESTPGELTDVSIADYAQWAIVSNGGPALTLTDVALTTDPSLSIEQDAGDFQNFSGSFGLIAIGPELSITGGVVSGHTGGGIFQSGNGDRVPFDMNGTVIDGNARFGVFTTGAEATFHDVEITHTLDDDASCSDEFYIYCNSAIRSEASRVQWTGGRIAENGMIGATVLQDAVTFTGTRFESAAEFGIWGVAAAVSLQDATMTGGKAVGMLLTGAATGVVTGTTFQDATWATEYDYGDGVTFKTYYAAEDVQVMDSTLIVQGSTFERGESGITAYGGTVEISGSTWTSYNADPVYVSSDSVAVITDTAFTDIGNEAVGCFQGTVQLDGVEVRAVSQSRARTEWYEEGVLQEDQTSEYTSIGSALYLSTCDAVLEDVVISEVAGTGLYGWDAQIEAEGVTFADVGTAASAAGAGIGLSYAGVGPSLSLTDVDVQNVPYGDGVRVVGYGVEGSVQLDEVSVKNAAGNGVTVRNIGGSHSLVGVTVDHVSANGIVLEGAPAFVEECVVDEVGLDGLVVSGGAVEIVGTTATGGTGSGARLVSGAHTVRASTLGGGRYGLECTGEPMADVTDCASNALTGDLGPWLDCGGCGPVDTGGGDTGAVDTDTAPAG